jgi:hypothetical protein
MKRFAAVCVMILPGLGLVVSAGCLPRQLVVWSPDGARAVVMDSNSTSLCDGDGKLARLDVGTAQAAAWTADSKRVLLAVQKSAAKWTDLAPVLDEPTRQAVIAAADDLEKAILASPAGEELTDKDAQEIAKKVFQGRNSLAPAATVYLRDARPDVIRKRLGDKWKDVQEKMSVTYTRLGLYDLDGMSLKPGPVILNSLKGVNDLRLAPDAKAVAYVTGSDRTENSFTLWLAPVTPNAAPRELADRVAIFPDFSADSRHVAYIQAALLSEGIPLGRLARRQVVDADGTIPDELPEAANLAALVFDNLLAARCLADGRIIFSSGDANLPAAVAEMQKSKSLFAFNPAEPAKVTRVVPNTGQTRLPVGLLFDLSPDQKQVSVAGNDATVCVVTLADGQITWVQQEGKEDKEGRLRMLPSWRRAGELCFIIPAAKGAPDARNEVALWSAGKTTVISKVWPDAVLENLTFAPSSKKPTTAPTTGPGTGFSPTPAPAK